jgi:hypothetical protein
VEVQREDLLDPQPARGYHVTTADGRAWDFISLRSEEEWLTGTVRFTSTDQAEGSTEPGNITNRYEDIRIPWTEVRKVEAQKQKGGDTGLWLVAGAIAAGAAVFLIATGGSDEPPPDNGGKGF